ncbi:hypothetical protein BT96DRAFT_817219, partial [Gymnopus androsaceus JB14]
YELLDDDWQNIQQVCSWLTIFHSATTQMSTTSKPMLSTTFAIFWGLQDELRKTIKELPHNVDPLLRTGLVDAFMKLSKYYGKFDESQYYTWAARGYFILFVYSWLTT